MLKSYHSYSSYAVSDTTYPIIPCHPTDVRRSSPRLWYPDEAFSEVRYMHKRKVSTLQSRNTLSTYGIFVTCGAINRYRRQLVSRVSAVWLRDIRRDDNLAITMLSDRTRPKSSRDSQDRPERRDKANFPLKSFDRWSHCLCHDNTSLRTPKLRSTTTVRRQCADVAAENVVGYVICSTLPDIKEMSGGKYTKAIHFDAMANAAKYVRGLRIKSASYPPGNFMKNFHAISFLAPQIARDCTWVMARHNGPKSTLALVDPVWGTGSYDGAILAEPNKYEGKTFCAATALYSLEEVATIIFKATHKTVVYKQIPVGEFKRNLFFGYDIFAETFSYGEEFRYFGPDSEKLVAWAAENARGRLTTLEEYLEARPLQLT